ncbi:hypothetical protein DSM3645_03893 [Blastopirellula marina DSM 3645]|uniref:Uncharacterized protein n=1 Tax=Blastopirellula marina DSM 3645 TaxID=314230 RepID=A3ZV67_9BACT|nr:hypothetical protein DSM3645_03893 [Blastopirellula marina DSM 3645]
MANDPTLERSRPTYKTWGTFAAHGTKRLPEASRSRRNRGLKRRPPVD